jgi:biotin carboxyl carrier protein
MAEKYLVRDAEAESEYEIDKGELGLRVRHGADGEWKHVELLRVGESQLYLLMVDNHPTELFLERRRGGATATIGRHTFDLDVERWRAQAAGRASREQAAGPRRITAPMTGSIIEVRCSVGQEVLAGDVLLVIESMKMNNELRSPAAGVVEQVPVTPGQRVNAGDLLVALNLKAE